MLPEAPKDVQGAWSQDHMWGFIGLASQPAPGVTQDLKEKKKKNSKILPNCKNCCVFNVFGLSSENQ